MDGIICYNKWKSRAGEDAFFLKKNVKIKTGYTK